MDRDQWLAHQLLPPRDGVSMAAVVASGGWIASAGGTGPYLSFHARVPSITRQQVDDVIFRRLEVVEVPCVRGTAMLVPRGDAGVALAAGRRSFQKRIKKLPMERKEIDALAERIVKTIGDGIRSTDQLRRDLPSKLIRDLDEPGARVALPSTLQVALLLLQCDGRVLRIPEERRLDGKRHFYRLWPLEIPTDAPADLDGALAERFLRWASPATVDDFAGWAGIGKTAAKKALRGVPPPTGVPTTSAASVVLLLPFRDNYFALHRGVAPFVNDDRIELLDMSNKPARADRLQSLHHNAVVVGGQLRGIWEYDPAEERIVWRMFGPARGVEAAVAKTEEFIRGELGDHKFYAFDRGRTREVRLSFVRG